MAQFAPYGQSTPAPSYIGMSKEPGPIKPNTAGGKLFEGIADIFSQAVSGIDEINQQNVEREGREGFSQAVDRERTELEQQIQQESGGATSFPPSQGPVAQSEGDALTRAQEGLPEPAQQQLDYLGRVKAGEQAGKVRPTESLMHAESIKSGLLSRYPGYAKQIDAVASKYGFSETRQNNDLRAKLNEIRSGKDKEAQKIYTWENQHRAEITALTNGQYWDIPREVRHANTKLQDELNKQIGAISGEKWRNDAERERMNFKEDVAKYQGAEHKRLINREVDLDIAVKFRGLMNSEFKLDAKDPSEAIQKFWQNPDNFRTENIQSVGRKLTEWEDSMVREQIQKYSQMKVAGMGEETVLGLMGPKAIEDQVRARLQPITGQFKAALSEGGAKANFSILESNSRYNQAVFDEKTRQLRERFPNAATMEGLQKMLGPSAPDVLPATGLYGKAAQEIKMWVDGVSERTATKTVNPNTGKPHTLTETINEYSHELKLNGVDSTGRPLPPRAQDMETLMDRIYTNIVNPKVPDVASKEFAAKVFSDPRLVPMIKDSERMNFVRKWAGPEVAERVYKYGDTKLIEDYQNFLINNAVAAGNHLAGDIKNVNEFKYYYTKAKQLGGTELSYDAKTNTIVGTVPSEEQVTQAIINAGGARSPSDIPIAQATARQAGRLVNELNGIVRSLKPVFDREGSSAASIHVQNLMTRFGIPVTGLETQEGKGTAKTTSITKEGQAFETLMQNPSASITYKGQSMTVQELLNKITPGADTGIEPGQAVPLTNTVPVIKAPTKDQRSELPSSALPLTAEARTQQASVESFLQNPTGAIPSTNVQQGSGTVTAPKTNPLASVIYRAEGTTKHGYDTMFGGGKLPVTNSTINEVIAFQNEQPRNQKAIGIGQFMPKTLESLKKEMGLTGNEKMTPELQDKMVETLMERRGLSQWRAGKITDEQFIDRLSKEWAGLPNSSGISAHHGVAGNKATVSLRSLKKALEEMREKRSDEGTVVSTELSSSKYRGPNRNTETGNTDWQREEAIMNAVARMNRTDAEGRATEGVKKLKELLDKPKPLR